MTHVRSQWWRAASITIALALLTSGCGAGKSRASPAIRALSSLGDFGGSPFVQKHSRSGITDRVKILLKVAGAS
jgi:hypothetical protein